MDRARATPGLGGGSSPALWMGVECGKEARKYFASTAHTLWLVVRGCPLRVPLNVTNFTCCRAWSWADGGRGGASSARPAPSAQDRAGRASAAATVELRPAASGQGSRAPPWPWGLGLTRPRGAARHVGRTLVEDAASPSPATGPEGREVHPTRVDTPASPDAPSLRLPARRPRRGHVVLTRVPQPSASPASQTSGL